MKKVVSAIVVVLIGIAGWAGASYVIGGQVEQHYRDHVARLAQWGPVQMNSESYQRGFLSSQGRTLLEIGVPVPAGESGEVEVETLRLTLEHRVCHGPLPVGSGSFSLVPQLARIETRLVAASLVGEDGEGSDLLAKLPWLAEIYSLASIGLDGRGRDQLVIPALEQTVGEKQLTITWGGLQSDTRFAKDMSSLAGNILLSSLQLKAEDGRLQWDGAQVDFDLQEAFPLVYLGRYRIDSGFLEMSFDKSGTGRQKVRVEGLVVDSLASQSSATVDYLQNLKVAKVDVNETGYGPAELEVAARGLDGEVLSRYQQDMLEVYGQESFDAEVVGMQMMQVYLRLLTGLAEGTPEIEFSKLQIATPHGDFSGNLRLKLNGGAGQELNHLPALLQKLEGQAQIAADESLVRKVMAGLVAQQIKNAYRQMDLAPPADKDLVARADSTVEQQLEALIGQQFIERADGKLRCQAVFDRGELKVNGNRVM
ncbi:MAG: YdgA family protein [Syntrophotaleaceae bacterium]